jgi:MFS family permease
MKFSLASLKSINWKTFAPAFTVTATSFIWYTLIYTLLFSEINYESNLKITIFGIYYAGIAISALIGAFVFPRFRKNGLILWMLFGTTVSLFMGTIPSNSFLVNLIIAFTIGVSIGIGLPTALSCFANAAVIEKRGSHGGITWFTYGIGVLLVGTIITLAQAQVIASPLILAAFRGIGLIVFVTLSRTKIDNDVEKYSQSFREILSRRDLLLYMVPWTMFSIINFSETPLVNFLSFKYFGNFSGYFPFFTLAIQGIVALICGILADSVGRKRIVIVGFILFGVEYALLSVAQTPITLIINLCIDGAAWGIFASVFFMTVWGDLAGQNTKEKYYFLGGMPFLLAGYLAIIVEPFAEKLLGTSGIIFSLASFFLFIAVLPLIYAPETLPEKIIQENELKNYVEKALQKVQKNESDNKTDDKNSNKADSSESDSHDEEAMKLAEKYY